MATTKPVYAASVSLNFSTNLNSLASSSNLRTGVQSDEVDNSTNRYDEVLVSGTIKLGTNPVASTFIGIWIVASLDGTTGVYPDTIGASTQGIGWGTTGMRDAGAKLLKTILVDTTTTGDEFSLNNEPISPLFGGVVPQFWVVYLSQSTTVALNSSAGSLNYLGVHWETS